MRGFIVVSRYKCKDEAENSDFLDNIKGHLHQDIPTVKNTGELSLNEVKNILTTFNSMDVKIHLFKFLSDLHMTFGCN